MYILGINGFGERSHDASACLFKDSRLIAFVEEERLVRKKHAYNLLPHNAIKFCLNKEGISETQIDLVAVGWNYKKMYKKIKKIINKNVFLKQLFPKSLFKKINPGVVFVNHHRAHASSAFRCSGFAEAAVLVIDGQGEEESTSIWNTKKGELKLVKKFPIKDSIGYFYEAATEFLGFSPDQYGKTMGLSSYGSPSYCFDNVIKLLSQGYLFKIHPKKNPTLDEQKSVREEWLKIFNVLLPQKKPEFIFDRISLQFERNVRFSRDHKDFAASIQKQTNSLICHLVKVAINLTGKKNVCIAGGVGLNCVANGKILEDKLCHRLFIQPLSNDAGVSLGAALEVLESKGIRGVGGLIKNYYMGPEFSNREIKEILKRKGISFEYVHNPSRVGAELINQGKIIGWFQGKMEAGPRALGNRSIIANPSKKEFKDLTNIIKKRELWRPLCPSILEKDISEYVKEKSLSPFMTFNFNIKRGVLKKIPAVVHIDKTARVQTVNKNLNPRYWSLISEFKKLSGKGIVLNTSLNSKNEPIACTPEDALRNLYDSQMDALIIGNYLIRK